MINREAIKTQIKEEVFKLCQAMYDNDLADADDICQSEERKQHYKDTEFKLRCDIIWRLQDFESVSYDDESEMELNFDDYDI